MKYNHINTFIGALLITFSLAGCGSGVTGSNIEIKIPEIQKLIKKMNRIVDKMNLREANTYLSKTSKNPDFRKVNDVEKARKRAKNFIIYTIEKRKKASDEKLRDDSQYIRNLIKTKALSSEAIVKAQEIDVQIITEILNSRAEKSRYAGNKQ